MKAQSVYLLNTRREAIRSGTPNRHSPEATAREAEVIAAETGLDTATIVRWLDDYSTHLTLSDLAEKSGDRLIAGAHLLAAAGIRQCIITRLPENHEDRLLPNPDCPRCGGPIPNATHPGAYPGALSRTDNLTEICSKCGVLEAVEQPHEGLLPQSQWVHPPTP